jgi:DNA-binding LacI/PurR family transcriptional regulator
VNQVGQPFGGARGAGTAAHHVAAGPNSAGARRGGPVAGAASRTGAAAQPGPAGAVLSATLADVAHAAGVSRQTVSNVLNAPHRVRPETRARVEEAIAELGYQPNRVAQALRAQASRLIGYRIEPMHAESLASIHDRFLHALAEAGQAADHQLLLFTADGPEDELRTCARLYRTGAVDGFVLYGIDHGDRRPRGLLDLGAPFAAFGRTDDDGGHVWVDVDNAAGTAAAVEHLAARGHRRIAFVGWPEGSGVGDRRAAGWRAALERHDLYAACAPLDVRGVDSAANGAQLGAILLDRPEPPTAVVTVTDTLAVGVMQAARARGLTVGRDLAVVGFDDSPTAGVLELSSVRQPIEAVARCIIRALLTRLPAGDNADPTAEPARPGRRGPDAGGPGADGRRRRGTAAESRLLAPALVVRASSAAPVPR